MPGCLRQQASAGASFFALASRPPQSCGRKLPTVDGAALWYRLIRLGHAAPDTSVRLACSASTDQSRRRMQHEFGSRCTSCSYCCVLAAAGPGGTAGGRPGSRTIEPGGPSPCGQDVRGAGPRGGGDRAAEQRAQDGGQARAAHGRPHRGREDRARPASTTAARSTSKRPAPATSSRSTDTDYVITNRHVIKAADPKNIKISLADGRADQSHQASGATWKPTSP